MNKKTIRNLAIALMVSPMLAMSPFAAAEDGGWDCPRASHKAAIGKKRHADPEQMMARRLARMTKQLDLTETQQQQLKQLFAQQHRLAQAHIQQQGLPSKHKLREAIRQLQPDSADYEQQVAAIRKMAADAALAKAERKISLHTAMARILTFEQMEKMEAMHSHRRR